ITEQWLSDDRLRRQVSDCAEGFIRRHRGASETIASLIAEAV
ncbi:MAG: 3-deoxy-D-manno-octulosonic acid transferase, partial [Neisseria sicca]|nr:3-deoxy-D-manno-octulosonic acid transferase [Neisseria sicca]